MKNNFNKNLKLIMFEKGLSQAELGKKMGIGQSRISKWITGYETPTIKNLEKIAKALDISVSELMDYQANKKNNTEYKSDKKDIEILKLKNEILKLQKENLKLKLENKIKKN